MRRAWIAIAVLAAAVASALSPLGADYGNLGCHVAAPRCDEPAWPLEALARGDLGRFVHDQPLMGPVSLVLRAPFAAVAYAFHADLTWHYRAGLFACLLVSALLALALAHRSRALGHPPVHVVLVGLLAFVNPLTISAIDAGHPEELVAAALVVGSALLVLDGRWTLAALAIGLAVATKAWAVLAFIPLLLLVAAPGRRRFALVTVAVVVALYAPLVAADAHRFSEVVRAAGSLGSRYGEATAPDAWFPTARAGVFTWPTAIRDGQMQFAEAGGYRISDAEAHVAHALVAGLALTLTLAWWRAGAARRKETLFLLLAAILLLRCIFDPGDHVYYHAAAALALVGWEAVRQGARFPWLAATFIGGLWLLTRISDHLRTDTAVSWVYLGFAIPMLALVVGLALNTDERFQRRAGPRTQRLALLRNG